jgi:hypothetical protein
MIAKIYYDLVHIMHFWNSFHLGEEPSFLLPWGPNILLAALGHIYVIEI